MASNLSLLPHTIFGRVMFTVSIMFLALMLFAAFVFRDDIYQSFLDPGIPYQTYQRPPAPDYMLRESWNVWTDAEDRTRPAVFFIHPTTYDGGSHWNAPIDREQEIDELNQIVLPNWAAPFLASDARLYAPHFRQASLYAFMNNREDSLQARQLAYSDVARAFEVFENQLDEHTAFVLVGVGQGALHGLRLLMDKIAVNEDLTRRLSTAYLLEAPTPVDLFTDGPLDTIPICQTETDIRCVVAFSSVTSNEANRIVMLTERSMSWTTGRQLDYVSGRSLACVNPLLWNTSEDYAPERLHKGGAAAENLTLDDAPSPMANQTGAQCQNGILFTERPRTPALRRQGRLGEDRRVPHFNLFYMDLQEDAQRRMDLSLSVLAEEARWAPPLMEAVEVRRAVVRPIDG